MANLTPSPRYQFINSNGEPLFQGKLYTYAAGTTTPLATYTTSAGNVENANPVILDEYGTAGVWLGSSLYKLVLKDADDATIWTVDNVGGIATTADVQAVYTTLAASGGSALIGFLQAGSGAVARTVQSKLRETVSVLDFIPPAEHAAIRAGTSTYDATADINAALQCGAIRVYIPQGTYLVTAGLTSSTAIQIYGDSAYTSVISSSNNAVDLLTFPANADFIRLYNFSVTFTSKGTGDGIVFTEGNNNLLCSGVNVTNADIGFNSVNVTFLQMYQGCRVNTSNTGFYCEGRTSGGSGAGTTVIYDQCYGNQCNTVIQAVAIREVICRQCVADFVNTNTAPTVVLANLCSVVQVEQLAAEGTIGADGYGLRVVGSPLDIAHLNGFACQITATGYNWYLASVEPSAGSSTLWMTNIAGRQATAVKRYRVVNSSGGSVIVNLQNNDWGSILDRTVSGVLGVCQENNLDKSASLSKVQMYDDFVGTTLSTMWNSRVGSDGQCVAAAILANQVYGQFQMTSGDDAGNTMAINGVQIEGALNWKAETGFLSFEARVMLGSLTSNVCWYLGFTDQNSALEMPFTLAAGDVLTSNATDAVGVLYDTASDTDEWCLVGVANNVDATLQFTGVAPTSNTLETWRVEVSQTGVATFYRNGSTIGTTMTGAVTPSVALCPVIAAFSRGAAVRNIVGDYILVQGNRP